MALAHDVILISGTANTTRMNGRPLNDRYLVRALSEIETWVHHPAQPASVQQRAAAKEAGRGYAPYLTELLPELSKPELQWVKAVLLTHLL